MFLLTGYQKETVFTFFPLILQFVCSHSANYTNIYLSNKKSQAYNCVSFMTFISKMKCCRDTEAKFYTCNYFIHFIKIIKCQR